MSEHNLQKACVQWFRMQHRNKLIFAIPNGGLRDKIVAKKLKDEGVLPGIPDLMIPIPKNGYGGIFIEMKYGNNRPTDEQNEILSELWDSGYKVEVCNSIEKFIEVVNNYFS